jgi:hypothetical protein
MKTRTGALLAVVALVALASGCAHQPEIGEIVEAPGFFKGLWHGLIVPFAFVGSIFSDVRIYAFPNGGVWYDLGFLVGIGAWGGGAASRR